MAIRHRVRKKVIKKKIKRGELCVIGSGSVKGNRRVTQWIVMCPTCPETQKHTFLNKKSAKRAQHLHVAAAHPKGDVIVG